MLFPILLPALAGCGSEENKIAPTSRYNLLLITLDTVRADHLGCYGYPTAETPALDRLAREGIRFEQAVAAAPLTLVSHATILTGLLPPHHGLHNNGAAVLPASVPTLATVLRDAGYRTGAFVGAFVLDHRFGLARGFQVYDDEVERGPAGAQLESERPGSAVVDRALAWLDQTQDRPFFAWVHLYDAHTPYAPPEPFKSRFATRPYDGEIGADDFQVGRLIADLERHQLDHRTLVAVAADHGEGLGEHGEMKHGLLLYESTLRVPWIVRTPGKERSGRMVHEPVGLADVAPTLLGLLGRSLPTVDGRDLSAVVRDGQEPSPSDLYSESEYARTLGWSALAALRRGKWKYIAAPRPELYDLQADPREAKSLLASERRIAADLGQRVAALRGPATPLPTPDAETRARLASLGYITAAAAPSSGEERDPKEFISTFRDFEEAHEFLNRGDTKGAVARFARLTAQDPTNNLFRAAYAEALQKSGDLTGSLAAYRSAVSAVPSDAKAWYNLATALQHADKIKEATDAIDEAIRLDPSSAEIRNARGVILALGGRGDEARSEFQRAVELDPRDATAWNNLGNAWRDAQRLDEAAGAYQRAIALQPEYPDPLNGMGVLEVQRRNPAAALPYFEQVLNLVPTQHEARLNRAVALDMMGQAEKATAAYADFLRAARGDPQFAAQVAAVRGLLQRRGKPPPSPATNRYP